MKPLLTAEQLTSMFPELNTTATTLTINPPTATPLLINPTTADNTTTAIFTHITADLFAWLANPAAHIVLPHELYALIQRLVAAHFLSTPQATCTLLISHYPQTIGKYTLLAMPSDELLPASYALSITYPSATGTTTGLYLGNWGSYASHKKRLKTARKTLQNHAEIAWAVITGTLKQHHNPITTAAINHQLSDFCAQHPTSLIQIHANWLTAERWGHLAAALHGSGRQLVVSPQLAALLAPTLTFDQTLSFYPDASALSAKLAHHPQLTPVTKATILANPAAFGVQHTPEFTAPTYVVPATPQPLTLTSAATIPHVITPSSLQQIAATFNRPLFFLANTTSKITLKK